MSFLLWIRWERIDADDFKDNNSYVVLPIGYNGQIMQTNMT